MHREQARTDTIRSGVTLHGRSSTSPVDVDRRVRRARKLIEKAEALIERGEQLLDAADTLLTDVCDRCYDDRTGGAERS